MCLPEKAVYRSYCWPSMKEGLALSVWLLTRVELGICFSFEGRVLLQFSEVDKGNAGIERCSFREGCLCCCDYQHRQLYKCVFGECCCLLRGWDRCKGGMVLYLIVRRQLCLLRAVSTGINERVGFVKTMTKLSIKVYGSKGCVDHVARIPGLAGTLVRVVL